ncbi:MAG: ABC transporter ATP-binding protein [Candidatus Aminicenantes bacterium]|nr:ABC transporter ATP-binding protein [Candidatus Aminicenantes bacterium]
MMGKAVEASHVSYTYPDGSRALFDITFSVFEGESVGIIGPNGAGKSTLLWHLNGILRGEGRTKVFGITLEKKNLFEIRKRVGLVFQDPNDQLFMPTVFDDVAFGPLNLGLSPDEVRKKVETKLEEMEICHLRDKPTAQLSIGEKKRVSLASVLVMDPKIVVLDEPTVSLDPCGRYRFMELIRSLPATKIISTHDLDLVRNLCSRVLVLDRGLLVADGPTNGIIDNAPLMEAHGLKPV